MSTQGWQGVTIELVKSDMLGYVQDIMIVRGMGRGLSDHYGVLRKVRLVGTWIKRGEVVVGLG